ncbi:probable plastid-lipid-associated protein 13, chloroplastic isoform X2 [Tripterygium wilfordii]|uniref:probable plastid-lipid-associated protein 13, chloroplastic isoform X2 n=1 Tax=Tripterygium wilfordii TaxID=458696 RepID=UPI0018F846A2|nr:probable plastid-lipid-associated protein 13, chloroplastic isoform X2 [Tripterygium wilfordii]
MASLHGSIPAIPAICSRPSSSLSSSTATSLLFLTRLPETDRKISVDRLTRRKLVCRAMVQPSVQGAPAAYAKDMERLSAKESLILAFKDSGGFEALVTGKTTDVQHIDVNERITDLERLNPTPRPTTSPFLEGLWNFEWFGSGSPGLFAARLIFQLTVEGPLRMKEEYVEGILETPTIIEDAVPEQVKGALGQALNTVQQLPVPVRDAFASGLKVPLAGTFQRLFMISYLDDEILIIRDAAGVPEVLTRFDTLPSSMAEPETEYES